MWHRRRMFWATCIVVAVAAQTQAFKVDYHAEITVDALGRVGRELPDDVKRGLQAAGVATTGLAAEAFTDNAKNEIVEANRARDLGHCDENEFDLTMPAHACTLYGTDTLPGLIFLSYEPEEQHSDNESIQVASNNVFLARAEIRKALLRRQFVGARKLLGGAIHTLQDFYAHSNWVELGNSQPEMRFGKELNAFKPGVLPRLAAKNEPMCFEGEKLLTQATKAEQDELIRRYEEAQRAGQDTKGITADMLRAVIRDRPITTGYFYIFYPEVSVDDLANLRELPGLKDPPVITDSGKCRHGWRVTYTHWTQVKVTYRQAGINKDEPESGTGFYSARQVAFEHTFRFVMEVITDPELKKDPNYASLILGLLGYDRRPVIEGFRIGVPGAPNGASWDTAIRGILTFNLKNIQPDISVCMESRTVPGTCAATCDDADWSNDLNAYVCEQSIGAPGAGLLLEKDLRVLVNEMDFGRPSRVIASFRVDDPRACQLVTTPTSGANPFCILQLDPDRSLWIQFKIGGVERYSGPRRPAVSLPPPETIPVAAPPSPSVSAPPSTTSTTPIATSTSPSASAFSSAGGSSSAPSTSTVSLRSAEGIDARLALRDLDNCVGSDLFYPRPTASSQVQVYQMAAFSLAISDATAKQALLTAIRTRVGDDAFFTVMNDVIANPLQSQALVTAYQNTAKNMAQQISSRGLTSLMPMPVPPSALASYVDRWVLSRLSSPALVSTAVDMMASGSGVTAECTINELAKQGFTDMVLAR